MFHFQRSKVLNPMLSFAFQQKQQKRTLKKDKTGTPSQKGQTNLSSDPPLKVSLLVSYKWKSPLKSQKKKRSEAKGPDGPRGPTAGHPGTAAWGALGLACVGRGEPNAKGSRRKCPHKRARNKKKGKKEVRKQASKQERKIERKKESKQTKINKQTSKQTNQIHKDMVVIRYAAIYTVMLLRYIHVHIGWVAAGRFAGRIPSAHCTLAMAIQATILDSLNAPVGQRNGRRH